jgi:hypothetical protein
VSLRRFPKGSHARVVTTTIIPLNGMMIAQIVLSVGSTYSQFTKKRENGMGNLSMTFLE